MDVFLCSKFLFTWPLKTFTKTNHVPKFAVAGEAVLGEAVLGEAVKLLIYSAKQQDEVKHLLNDPSV